MAHWRGTKNTSLQLMLSEHVRILKGNTLTALSISSNVTYILSIVMKITKNIEQNQAMQSIG